MQVYPDRLLTMAKQKSKEGERILSSGIGGRIFGSAATPTVLRRLTWIVPLVLFLMVVGYQLGPATWIHNQLGHRYHIVAEIIVFGTAGPLLASGTLYLFRRWLEERDTSEWQAQLLELNREQARRNRKLNDDTLQVLFAAGAMLDTLKEAQPSDDPELLARVEATEAALETAVNELRSHLLDE